jgi:tRNA(Met) C34 N-acetyltransferase TmcA
VIGAEQTRGWIAKALAHPRDRGKSVAAGIVANLAMALLQTGEAVYTALQFDRACEAS